MKKTWFDFIYYALNDYKIDSNVFKKICDCEQEILKLGDEEDPKTKEKKAKFINSWLFKNGLLNEQTAKRTNEFVNNTDNVTQKYYDKVEKAYSTLDSLSFDDPVKSSEILTRIIRTKGKYLDPSYIWNQEKEDESNNDYKAQDASVFIKNIEALRNSEQTMKNLLEVFFSIPELYDLLNTDFDYINVLVETAKRISDTSSLENDTRKQVIAVFNEMPETDKELLNAIENAKSNETSAVFDTKGITEAVERVSQIFEEKNDIIVEFISDELSKTPQVNASDKSNDIKGAYKNIETLIEWTIEYPEYSSALIKDSFDAIIEILKKTSEYVKQLEEIAENKYNKFLTESLYVNRIELTMPECLAKWQGFIHSDMCKDEFSDKLVDDIKNNISPEIYEKKKDTFEKYISKEGVCDTINLIRDLNINQKSGVPETVFVNRAPNYYQKLKQWSLLLEFLFDFFNQNFDEKKEIVLDKSIDKNYYDAACILIYMLTSDKSENIRIGNKKVVESFGKYSEVMIFEKTVLQSSYADFKSLFDKVYKNFTSMKIGFEEFINGIVKSYNGIAEKPEKPSAEQSQINPETAKEIRNKADGVKQALANISQGR